MPNKITTTIDKAYGNIPKEVGFIFDFSLPVPRGIKFYWLKLLRKFQGR
jgi:hypothetical protein